MPLYRWLGFGSPVLVGLRPASLATTVTGSVAYTAAAVGGGSLAYDWTATNRPSVSSSTSDFMSKIPTGTTVVDIQTASTDFWTNLNNTVNAAGGARIIVRLAAGTYHLKSFRLIGSSGSPTYAFGFWFSKLQGLVGQGDHLTFVQMDANSMSQAQLDDMATMTSDALGQPNLMGLCRIDGTTTSPAFVGGITFQAADQQNLTSTAATNVVVPQPAPHQGVVVGYGASGTKAIFSYCRFLGAGRASSSLPPFEHANVTSSRATISFDHCESDGRRAASIDPARPRRCSVIMGNNELLHEITDSWFHHSNVSRYAINDQNSGATGAYKGTRCKLDQITNTQNTDPAMNGGNSLGGWSNASNMGWETTNAPITLTDMIVSVDNSNTSGQVPCHLQFTTVGSVSRTGPRLYVYGGVWRNTGFPSIDGFLTVRAAPNTIPWVTEGYANTMFIYNQSGGRMTQYVYTGSWTNSALASMVASSGISPTTHYIVKN